MIKQKASEVEYIRERRSAGEIVSMGTEERWRLISEGRFGSLADAESYASEYPDGSERLWKGLTVSLRIPVWRWGRRHGADDPWFKEKAHVDIIVNGALSAYFLSFFCGLFNAPERYVIEDADCFYYRTRNNGMPAASLSAHSFGSAVDINSHVPGMGSLAAGIGQGIPFGLPDDAEEPYRSMVCALTGGTWRTLVDKYGLVWGGLWREDRLDPMHFSAVGDEEVPLALGHERKSC